MRTEIRAKVYDALDSERDHQARRWGERPHEAAAWILFMEHHLAKARVLATALAGDTAALNEIRKVTALGVACMEQHGAPRRAKDAPIKPTTA